MRTCQSDCFETENQKICKMIVKLHLKNQVYTKAYAYSLRTNDLET